VGSQHLEGIVSKNDLEERLLKAIIIVAKQVVKEVVEWAEDSPDWTVGEAELFLRGVTQVIPRICINQLVEERREMAERDRICRHCGERMRDKGRQSRQSETLVGRLKYTRRYYYCERCREGRYPLDEAIGTGPGQMSDTCQSSLSCVGAALPFGAAAKVFTRLTGIYVSARQTARITEQRGARLDRERAIECEAALAGRVPEGQDQEEHLWCVSLDAAKVRFLDGWHEVKAAVVFQAQSQPGEDERVRAVRQSYLAQVGPMDRAGERLYAEAIRRGVRPTREKVVCLGDGAPANWSQFDLHFPTRIEVLDWYHATQHLWAAGKGVFGEGTQAAQNWVEAQKESLWAGKVTSVLDNLRQVAISEHGQAAADEIHYFEANQKRMQYAKLRQKGCPRGSGTVESACKQVIAARARLAGMRWSEEGLQAVLSLRAEILSDRWDETWPLTRPSRLNA